MPEFFSYDPLSGVTRYFDYEEDTHKVRIHSQQDVEPYLKRTEFLARTGATDAAWKKHDFTLYAELPPVVQLELKNKGIDIYSKDPTMIRRMMDEINTKYKRFKTTEKVHR